MVRHLGAQPLRATHTRLPSPRLTVSLPGSRLQHLPLRMHYPLRASADSPMPMSSSSEGDSSTDFKPLVAVKQGLAQVWKTITNFLTGVAQNIERALLARVPLFMGIWIVYVKKAFQAAFLKPEVAKPIPSTAKADLSPFLFPLEVEDVRIIRKMSAMAALSYRPLKLNPKGMERRMKMKFLDSSYKVKAAKLAAEEAAGTVPKKGPFSMVSEIWNTATSTLSSSEEKDSYLDFTFLEWFTAEEPQTNTRYFAVMGSDTVDHWRLNLTLDPATFEDPDLGVKIHGGVYEAAENLYAKFLPSVVEHLEGNPNGKVCFLGHSIGGSMAVALMLMFYLRGVIKRENIADVYTFGMPSVFLEAEDCFKRIVSDEDSWDSWDSEGAVHDHAKGCRFQTHCSLCSNGSRGLLEAVGLPETKIRNIIMAFDFVPRAFTCDYNGVAELIREMGPGLVNHSQLSRKGRKHLFFYVGKVIILQPDSELSFVGEEGPHPMLPAEPEIYALESPNRLINYRPPHLPIPGDSAPPTSGSFVPASAAEALSELMDNPHPMEMFNKPMWTYGGNGGISRYHNPENYTRALGRAVFVKLRDGSIKKMPNVKSLAATVR